MADQLAVFVDQAVRATGVPLISVTIGKPGDKATWRAQLAPSATPAQQATADAAIAAFDPATVATLTADAQADEDLKDKKVRTLLVYIWRKDHAGANPTGAQLNGEIATLKAIWKALA